jgi:hypothetical protein
MSTQPGNRSRSVTIKLPSLPRRKKQELLVYMKGLLNNEAIKADLHKEEKIYYLCKNKRVKLQPLKYTRPVREVHEEYQMRSKWLSWEIKQALTDGKLGELQTIINKYELGKA